MDRSNKNKENKSFCKHKSINSYFKVSKRLFEPNKLECTSPSSNLIQPSSPAWAQDDSPYLYEIRKKHLASKCSAEAMSTPSSSALDETPLKRSGSSTKLRTCLSTSIMEISSHVIMESPKSAVMKIVEQVMDIEEEGTLSGDFSQKCILPVIKGRHPELNTITAETVAWLLVANHNFDVTIIDCRYPYEFNAGHIKNAINLFSQENVDEDFFNSDVTKLYDGKRMKSERLLIFYCEFSSERAPNMMRFIRNRDRFLNDGLYPFVYYPEMYLLDGGYKSFYASFKELCEPQNYKPMLAKENARDLVYYKSLCKSWNFKQQKEDKW
ncbi:M-phase inducer phosphatase 1-A like protein [Argiope bruennichi]|uniref:M-phase inducer phosphatase n=1 Tax=Argiope bruennichi TaxID=94029 RepID=A0A8T0EV94_ARGBR|nr:M-phase inducer phosphatase 1-A like protein [Argiope bruennichi]